MTGARRRPYHVLRICVTCQGRGAGGDVIDVEPRPGRALFELVKDHAVPSHRAQVRGIHCLGNCLHPCNAVFTGRGKALVMLSDLTPDPATAEELLAAFERYMRSETGRPFRGGLGRRADRRGRRRTRLLG